MHPLQGGQDADVACKEVLLVMSHANMILTGTSHKPWQKSGYRPSLQTRLYHSVPSHLEQHCGKVIIVDNYDSFTYNLSQVGTIYLWQF